MKRFLLILAFLLWAAAPALGEDAARDAALLSALQEAYPGLQNAVTDSWGNTAAAAFEYDGVKILCILDKQNDAWRITLSNPHALVQEEALPSLLLDSDDALFWMYSAYPQATYTVMRTKGVWGGVNQMARTTGGDGESMEDEVFYQDGQIVHNWHHFDKNENRLGSFTERMPAPWLECGGNLADFDIARFPVIGSVEYDGQWPERAYIQQAAAYLMPTYAFVSGSYSNGRLRFLMERPDGALVFVGCGTENHPTLVESSPLPKGTYYGVENFTNSLGIGQFCVTLQPYHKGGDDWGIALVMPYGYSGDELYFRPDSIYTGAYSTATQVCFGAHPWSDITGIDWTALPRTFSEAMDCVNGDGWALVSNPNPADRLHLRASPDTSSPSLGKYYNGTPVKVTETQGDWAKVETLGQGGWMLKKYLSFQQPYETTLSAMPRMQVKSGIARLYETPDTAGAYREIDNSGDGTMLVAGILGDEWYHVLFLSTGVTGYIRQKELFPGNG